MRRSGSNLPAISVLWLISAASVAAQNLVINPDLDENIDGWVDNQGTASWIAFDADDCHLTAGSGGISMSWNGGLHQNAEVYGECFAVTPSQQLCISFEFWDGADINYLAALYYFDSTCFMPVGGGISTPSSPANPNFFETLQACGTLPANVTGIRLSAVGFPSSQFPFTMVVDRFYAGSRQRIFADDFEQGSTCRWDIAP